MSIIRYYGKWLESASPQPVTIIKHHRHVSTVKITSNNLIQQIKLFTFKFKVNFADLNLRVIECCIATFTSVGLPVTMQIMIITSTCPYSKSSSKAVS